MFQTKDVQEIKTHILCPVTFFRKSCRFLDNVEIWDSGAGHMTIRTMRITYWVTKGTQLHTHTQNM